MSPDDTDQTQQLVGLLNGKDPQGAVMLQRLHRDALTRFCMGYLGRLEEAEDAVQEILLKVIKAPEVPNHLRAWLYKIARNHCLKIAQKRAARDGQIQHSSQIPESLTGQLTRLIKDEAQARFSEAFASLSDEQQEALRLRYVENLSRSEVAEILEVPESVVKSRLFEGMKKLRDQASRLEMR